MWNPSAWFLMEEPMQLPSTPMQWQGSNWNTRNTQTAFTLSWPWDRAPSTPLSSTLVYQVSVTLLLYDLQTMPHLPHCLQLSFTRWVKRYPIYPIVFNSRLPGECNAVAVMTLGPCRIYPIVFNSRLPGECNTVAVWPWDHTPSTPLSSTLVYQVSVTLLLYDHQMIPHLPHCLQLSFTRWV